MKLMDQPMAWAGHLVAISAKSVAALFHGVCGGAAAVWNTCNTAIACSADAASPADV